MLGLGTARPRSALGGRDRGGLRLACACLLGPSLPSLPWAPRASSGSPRPYGAAPESSSPSTTTTRALRPQDGLRACLARRAAAVTLPRGRRRRGRACGPSPGPRRSSSACSRRRPAPPDSGSPPLPAGIPARFTPIPTLTTQEPAPTPIRGGPYAHFTSGLARARTPTGIPHRSFATGTTPDKETRDVQQERKQQRSAEERRRGGRQERAQARRRDTRRARVALGRAPARRHPGPRSAPRPRAGLPAQGAGRQVLRLPRRPRRHRPGQPDIRLWRLGLRAGRRRDPASVRHRRPSDRRGHDCQRLHGPGAGHRRRRSSPHRSRLSRRDGRDRPTGTTPPRRAPSRTG